MDRQSLEKLQTSDFPLPGWIFLRFSPEEEQAALLTRLPVRLLSPVIPVPAPCDDPWDEASSDDPWHEASSDDPWHGACSDDPCHGASSDDPWPEASSVSQFHI